MNLITIGRVGSYTPANVLSVRADRKSVIGNPFWMANESLRDDVCNKYQAHFDVQIKIKGSPTHVEVTRLYKLLMKGQAIQLQCHCYPKRCHTHTIKNFLEQYL